MVTRLCDIKPGMSDLTVRARICRLWRGKMLMDVEKANDGLQCVLVDRNNNAIHGIVSETDYEDVKDNIQLGLTYEITNFHTINNQTTYIVVPHEARLLFNNRTVFNELPEVYPPFPRYWFQFVSYNELAKRKSDDTVLSDVIGRIVSIHEVEDVDLKIRIAPKRSIDVQDLRGNHLTVNLWGATGLKFDVAAIQRELYPVILAITSTKVRTFDKQINVSNGMSSCIFINPSIPETEEYRRRFVGEAYAPRIITGASKKPQKAPIDISTVKLISMKSLNMMRSVSEQEKRQMDVQGVSFFTEGTITKIMCREDLYYWGCPRCLKQMRFQSSSGKKECPRHPEYSEAPMYKLQIRAEDATDSAALMVIGRGGDSLFGMTCAEVLNEEEEMPKDSPPKSLMKLLGQKRILEVVHGTRNDFVIKSAHAAIDEESPQPSNMKTPEKQAFKRTYRTQREMNGKELSSQETPKKQKSEQGAGRTQKQSPVQDVEDYLLSEGEEDFTLSQLFNQQLQEKKNSRPAKALVIGKKSSEQSNIPAAGPKKQSERIKNKNKAKME